MEFCPHHTTATNKLDAKSIKGIFLDTVQKMRWVIEFGYCNSKSKYGRKRGQVLVGKISTLIALVTGAITLILAIFPSNIIDAVAPGLLKEYSQNGSITRNLAIIQLRIMAPCTLMAGLIGVGFGSLSAAGVYEVLALSPSLSSLSIIVVVIMYIAFLGIHNHSLGNPITGAISLALGVLIGAFCQLLWQVREHYALGFPFLQFHPVNPFTDKDIYEIAMVLFPAILGSSMLQFATLTDLYFASFIPEAAAGLGYANLLVMAPLGILSSSIILPMISLFAEFIEPPDFAALKDRLSEAILLVLVTSLSMTAIVLPLSRPLVEVVLQRLSFGVSASTMVSSILSYYIAGSSIYLMREVFIQLFYILGDGKTPFCISIAAIAVNALLDWALVRAFSFGPEGLVLATTLVHTLSIVALIAILYRKLDGLPLRKWLYFCGLIFGASILAGGATKTSYKWGFGVLLKLRLLWVVKICSMLFASCIGLTTFCLVICIFGQTEIQILKRLFYRRLKKQI